MKKFLCCLFLFFITACSHDKQVIIDSPTSQDIGSVCTLVTSFDDDIYNISIFYVTNDNYPVLSNDLSSIVDLSLKYSVNGSLNIKDYAVDKDKALSACHMSHHSETIGLATQVHHDDYHALIQDLQNKSFTFKVMKDNQSFQVKKNNLVVQATNLQINQKD